MQERPDPRAAIMRRLSGHGQTVASATDPKVAAFQYSRGLPATGEVDASTLGAGWQASQGNDPMASNPYVQAYGQFDMNDYNNGYGRPQGSDPQQLLKLRQMQSGQQVQR